MSKKTISQMEAVLLDRSEKVKYEKSLALEKLKTRRSDTRRKIELGGLVIKAGFDVHNKATILGAIVYAQQLVTDDKNYLLLFENIGSNLFLELTTNRLIFMDPQLSNKS